ncbi:MAG: type II toxin-antitoxin system RelE/ParE family toxin [Rhizobiaceae bacterium]|nr:type II toxin-antitoxin system RelE/ParE family toxin [Rhizobiaceae bacterium]
MAYQVVWSPEAFKDIDEIVGFIAKDSPFYAQVVVEKIIDASRSLDESPQRGRIVPEISDPSHREIFIHSYRLIYEIEAETVSILAMIHGKRLLSSIERLDLEE